MRQLTNVQKQQARVDSFGSEGLTVRTTKGVGKLGPCCVVPQ